MIYFTLSGKERRDFRGQSIALIDRALPPHLLIRDVTAESPHRQTFQR